MKTYNSMYVGLCVNNNDPEERGRVQIFIPHIMPSLNESLSGGQDIEITCIGDNMINGLDGKTLDLLKKILPWAEAASPILCGSSPGLVVRDEGGKAILNQSPVSNATAYSAGISEKQISGKIDDVKKDLLQKAAAYAGTDARGEQVRKGFESEIAGDPIGFQGNCARGSFAYLAAMVGGKGGFVGGAVGANAEDFTANGQLFKGGGSNQITKSGFYKTGQVIGSSNNFVPQIGDMVARGKHIQIYDGTTWHSDGPQRGIGGVGEDGVLYRMNDAGLAAIKESSPALFEQALKQQNPTNSQQKALTTTDSSGRPAAAEAGPQATKNPLATSGLVDSAAQSIPKKGELSSNILHDGKQVNPLSLRDDAYNYILATNPNFLRNLPPGAAELGMLQEGVNGVTREQAARSVADVIAKMGGYEAGYKISSSNTQDEGGSFGTLQFSALHANLYYGKNNNINITPEALNSDPGLGTRTFVGLLENFSNRSAPIYTSSNRAGFLNSSGTSGVIAARTMRLLAESKNLTLEQSLATDKELKDYKNLTKIGGPNSQYTNTSETIDKLSNQPNLVLNPDKGGKTPIVNTNNMPKGLFTYPAVGAMLWVFFREGNPLFPVYFAASYGKTEWAGAYGNTSPAVGNPGKENPPGVVTQSTVFNTGAGGFKTEQVIDHNNIENNKTNFSIFGPGSNQLHLTEGAAYFYFRDYLRHQVEGPMYESVLGNHESWIQGDSNSVFLGARRVITGTLTRESINAALELQKLMNEIQAPMSKPAK